MVAKMGVSATETFFCFTCSLEHNPDSEDNSKECKLLRNTIRTICEHLLIPTDDIDEIMLNVKFPFFCPPCLAIAHEIIEITKKVEELQLQIRHMVESLGIVVRDTSGEVLLKRAEQIVNNESEEILMDKFNKSVIRNYMRGLLPHLTVGDDPDFSEVVETDETETEPSSMPKLELKQPIEGNVLEVNGTETEHSSMPLLIELNQPIQVNVLEANNMTEIELSTEEIETLLESEDEHLVTQSSASKAKEIEHPVEHCTSYLRPSSPNLPKVLLEEDGTETEHLSTSQQLENLTESEELIQHQVIESSAAEPEPFQKPPIEHFNPIERSSSPNLPDVLLEADETEELSTSQQLVTPPESEEPVQDLVTQSSALQPTTEINQHIQQESFIEHTSPYEKSSSPPIPDIIEDEDEDVWSMGDEYEMPCLSPALEAEEQFDIDYVEIKTEGSESPPPVNDTELEDQLLSDSPPIEPRETRLRTRLRKQPSTCNAEIQTSKTHIPIKRPDRRKVIVSSDSDNSDSDSDVSDDSFIEPRETRLRTRLRQPVRPSVRNIEKQKSQTVISSKRRKKTVLNGSDSCVNAKISISKEGSSEDQCQPHESSKSADVTSKQKRQPPQLNKLDSSPLNSETDSQIQQKSQSPQLNQLDSLPLNSETILSSKRLRKPKLNFLNSRVNEKLCISKEGSSEMRQKKNTDECQPHVVSNSANVTPKQKSQPSQLTQLDSLSLNSENQNSETVLSSKRLRKTNQNGSDSYKNAKISISKKGRPQRPRRNSDDGDYQPSNIPKPTKVKPKIKRPRLSQPDVSSTNIPKMRSIEELSDVNTFVNWISHLTPVIPMFPQDFDF